MRILTSSQNIKKSDKNNTGFKFTPLTCFIAAVVLSLLSLQANGYLLQPFDSLISGIAGGITGITGKVFRTFVYGTGSLLKSKNELICPLATFESSIPYNEPTLYIFAKPDQPEKALLIYGDEELDDVLFNQSGLLATKKTVFLIHGWLGSIQGLQWPIATRDTAMGTLNSSQHQVIVVDWPKSASSSLYKVFNNTFVISKRLSKMFKWLAEVGKMNPSDWHCLGHSYGTHICGIASREAFGPRVMGRITGLDPGGFCFELGYKDTQNYYGLRPTDAKQVDAYVTNRSPFGNRYNLAQFSVRVGDGTHQTEQCSVWSSQSTARKYFEASVRFLFGRHDSNEILTCDHFFSTKFAFQQLSQAKNCQYVAYLCDSYDDFIKGRCGDCGQGTGTPGPPNQCYMMDFPYQQQNEEARKLLDKQRNEIERLYSATDMQRRLYFMLTSKEEPYCAHLYHIRVILMEDMVEAPPELEIFFILRDQTTHAKTKFGPIHLHGPWPEYRETMTAIVEMNQFDEMPLFIAAIILVGTEQNGSLSLKDVASVQISYMSSLVPEIRDRRSFTLEKDRITVRYKRQTSQG